MQKRTDCPIADSMTELTSFRKIIERWPTREALAADLSAVVAEQVSSSQISKWWQRDNIPSEWWAALLATPKAAEHGITADLLTVLAAREVAEARA